MLSDRHSYSSSSSNARKHHSLQLLMHVTDHTCLRPRTRYINILNYELFRPTEITKTKICYSVPKDFLSLMPSVPKYFLLMIKGGNRKRARIEKGGDRRLFEITIFIENLVADRDPLFFCWESLFFSMTL